MTPLTDNQTSWARLLAKLRMDAPEDEPTFEWDPDVDWESAFITVLIVAALAVWAWAASL
jgi:hypothetical protein